MRLAPVLRRAIVSGAIASSTSAAALALAARAEGRSAAQPLNATSHWLHGDRAARREAWDGTHTGTGYATHLAATIFWAIAFEAWQTRDGRRHPGRRLVRATGVSLLAATVDYTITPRRFTPGWELVLSKRGMALAYLAMAFGLAAAPTHGGA